MFSAGIIDRSGGAASVCLLLGIGAMLGSLPPSHGDVRMDWSDPLAYFWVLTCSVPCWQLPDYSGCVGVSGSAFQLTRDSLHTATAEAHGRAAWLSFTVGQKVMAEALVGDTLQQCQRSCGLDHFGFISTVLRDAFHEYHRR
jgi:hypothetical protein